LVQETQAVQESHHPKNQSVRKSPGKSVKYEEIYLRAYECTSEARANLIRYLTFYNRTRPHSALDGQTPDQVYFESTNPAALAA
jgi:putative transposase